MTIHYFAYGSNMASHRLLQRVPGAICNGMARLSHHRLSFGIGHVSGSGKCGIFETGNHADQVWGVTFKMSITEKTILDRYESHGVRYHDKMVKIESVDGNNYEALTYYPLILESDIVPFHWYKEHVLRGAIEHKLPTDYIKSISEIASQNDSDLARHERELAIYR